MVQIWLSQLQTKVHKRHVLLNPSCFGCLGCNESSDVTAIVVVLLLLCVAGVILFSLELRAETWCCPSQNGLRQNDVFRPFR